MVSRGAVILLFLLLGTGAGGCILIPMPQSTKGEGVRTRLTSDDVEAVKPGETRRRDLFLLLGEPDEVHTVGSDTYDCYVTGATRTNVVVGVVVGMAGAGGTFRDASREFLLVKSNEAGVVRKHAFRTLRFRVDWNERPTTPTSVLGVIEEWETQSDRPRSRPRLGKP